MKTSTSVTIKISCPNCGKRHYVTCNKSEYENWLNGKLIQNAMPELTPTEREQLISRLCPACQEKVFCSDEDDWWDC